MKGYWLNTPTGEVNSSPVVLSDEEEIIGLPPCMCGNSINNLLTANSNSSIDMSSLSFSPKKYLPLYPSPYLRSFMYYEIADFVPPQYIPYTTEPWLGYSYLYENINENGYKTLFIPSQTEPVTSCKSYKLKCKIIRLSESGGSSTLDSIDELYNRLERYKKYYELNFYNNNDLLQLPTFMGNLGIKPGSGGTQKSVTMKQNTKYVGIKTSGGGQENININSLFLPRYHIGNAELDNWISTGDFSTSPVPSFIMSPYIVRTTNSTERLDDVFPFFLNMCSSGEILHTRSGGSESYLNKNFNLNKFKTSGDLVNIDNYGYRQNDYNLFTNIPYIASNQIVKFGDGNGILDIPISENYTYNNRVFNSKDCLRYCFIDFSNVYISTSYRINSVYWIITYLDNEIQTLTVDKTKPSDWYGHLESNTIN